MSIIWNTIARTFCTHTVIVDRAQLQRAVITLPNVWLSPLISCYLNESWTLMHRIKYNNISISNGNDSDLG